MKQLSRYTATHPKLNEKIEDYLQGVLRQLNKHLVGEDESQAFLYIKITREPRMNFNNASTPENK